MSRVSGIVYNLVGGVLHDDVLRYVQESVCRYTVAITYHNVGVHPLVSRCDNRVQLSGLLGTRLLIPDTQVSSVIYTTNGT